MIVLLHTQSPDDVAVLICRSRFSSFQAFRPFVNFIRAKVSICEIPSITRDYSGHGGVDQRKDPLASVLIGITDGRILLLKIK